MSCASFERNAVIDPDEFTQDPIRSPCHGCDVNAVGIDVAPDVTDTSFIAHRVQEVQSARNHYSIGLIS